MDLFLTTDRQQWCVECAAASGVSGTAGIRGEILERDDRIRDRLACLVVTDMSSNQSLRALAMHQNVDHSRKHQQSKGDHSPNHKRDARDGGTLVKNSEIFCTGSAPSSECNSLSGLGGLITSINTLSSAVYWQVAALEKRGKGCISLHSPITTGVSCRAEAPHRAM